MNNVNWGFISDGDLADLMTPGEHAGEGRCQPGEWGVMAEDVVVYGSLAAMRNWATSLLNQLPPERDLTIDPLVVVDRAKQWTWLASTDALGDTDDDVDEWTPTVESVGDLLALIAADPAGAGWTLGDGVDGLWASVDEDTCDLIVGVSLTDGPAVGIGEPLTDEDLTGNVTGPVYLADAALVLIAERINRSY